MGLQPSGFIRSFRKDLERKLRGFTKFNHLALSWQQLNIDFEEFQKKIEDIDRRLATIFCQGFDDCSCLTSAVKVLCPQHGAACWGHRGVSALLWDALESQSQHLFLPQLVHMFSFLLERPVIKAELSPHYSALLEMFRAELEGVKVLYDTQISSPLPHGTGLAINKNMPPVAGQLKWALELQERLEGQYKDLFSIDHPYVWVTHGTWGRVWPCVCLLPLQ